MRIETLPPRVKAVPNLEIADRIAVERVASTGNGATDTGKPLPQTMPAMEAVHAAAAMIEEYIRDSGRELAFSVDDATGHMVVVVRDPTNGEVIRQLPSEEALRIARNLEAAGPALVSEFA